MALAAVFAGLWWTGIELNITVMMGMTMIVGIVTEVSIFLFSEYHDLLEAGMDRNEALIQMQQPLAVAIISGLVVQMPLVLMQSPVLYAVLSRRSKRPRR